jgi:hypothetical protein
MAGNSILKIPDTKAPRAVTHNLVKERNHIDLVARQTRQMTRKLRFPFVLFA